jgi:hypothetical protein
MNKSKRRPNPHITYRLGLKRLVDHHCLAPGSVLIDQVFDRDAGRFRDFDPDDQIEGNFYLEDKAEGPVASSRSPLQDAAAAVVGAAFDAATTPELRRRLRHCQALCVVVQVPTVAWIEPTSAYFRETFGERWRQRVHGKPPASGYNASAAARAVAHDLSSGQSVAAISADDSLLPQVLLTAADIRIRLAAPDGTVIGAAISRFTRRKPGELADPVAAGLDFDDILAAFRPGTGPEKIAQRLASAAAALPSRRGRKEKSAC